MQEIMFREHGLLAAYQSRQLEDKEESQCHTCARTATVSLLEHNVWWVSGERPTKWWCAICEEKYDWRQPSRLVVVQTGESFEQAKVFKAHAVPQGLCANLINALKVAGESARRMETVSSESIVTNLGKESRQGLTDGLQEFSKVDHERALGCWSA